MPLFYKSLFEPSEDSNGDEWWAVAMVFLTPAAPGAPSGPEGVARGEDALSLLESPQTRNQFIDELMEVRAPPPCSRFGSRLLPLSVAAIRSPVHLANEC